MSECIDLDVETGFNLTMLGLGDVIILGIKFFCLQFNFNIFISFKLNIFKLYRIFLQEDRVIIQNLRYLISKHLLECKNKV